MKRKIEETGAIKILEKFEEMAILVPSAGWDESLMNKITHSRSSPTSKNTFSSLGVLIAVVLLCNVAFVLLTLRNTKIPNTAHSEDYRPLASELLINPISAN